MIKRLTINSTSLLAAIVLLAGCSEADKPESMSSLMGQTTSGYAEVVKGAEFRFPQDHQPHPDFRQEWWYLTANLKTDQGQPLGLQWTQFRIAVSPETSQQDGWATNQIYFAHTAITSREQHLAEEKWSREHPQLAGVTKNPFSVKLDNWQWQSEGTNLFPASLSADSDQFSYQLKLTSDKPFQLQGEQGYSQKNTKGDMASYYYSQPFIEITGSVNINGKEQQVTGKGWLDREWSSQFLSKSQQGWDWFALRLNDGSALMLFQLRNSDDKKNSFYSGRRMYPDGSGRNITSQQIKLTATRQHKIEGHYYPVGWQIQIPSEQIDVEISPVNDNAKMPLSVSYWEGPVTFSGSHSGEGYMELTGY